MKMQRRTHSKTGQRKLQQRLRPCSIQTTPSSTPLTPSPSPSLCPVLPPSPPDIFYQFESKDTVHKHFFHGAASDTSSHDHRDPPSSRSSPTHRQSTPGDILCISVAFSNSYGLMFLHWCLIF
ncbi:hypothetical protein NL108_012069 [Boleophthalmus pectinirostris]|nr:hypothetical protein NL108_012069 [Boleophthalmus pectinirostris]